MAFFSVVTNGFTRKVVDALERLQELNGPITLAVMTPFDLGSGERWNLNIAAPWLDRMSLREASHYLREYFRAELGSFSEQYQGSFIVRTTESLVSDMSRNFDVRELGTAYRIEGITSDPLAGDGALLFIARPIPVRPAQTTFA